MYKSIKIPRIYGEKARRLLRKEGLLADDLEIAREGKHIILPVTNIDNALKILRDNDIPAEIILYRHRQRRIIYSGEIPGHDIVAGIVIVRDKVLEKYGRDKIIEIFRRLYPRLRAIYIKRGTETTHRVSRLELLWGEAVREIIYKEYGLRFFVDLENVYFNPRLSTEHRLLAKEVSDGEIVFDLFSGIGGFTLHIAVLGRNTIYANDINPIAVKCLIKSIELNKRLIKSSIIVSNMDANEIHTIAREGVADRIIANLPLYSHLFFNVYNYLAHGDTILHLYTVSHIDEDPVRRLEPYIRGLWKPLYKRKVIDYAPRTYIYRLDLRKL